AHHRAPHPFPTRRSSDLRLLWRSRDREERVQLGQLEQRLEIFVQAAEPEVSTLLADLLRERHQDAKAGRIDIAGLGEVDDELLRSEEHTSELQSLAYLVC